MFQYIEDSDGKTTGVFVPINEWKEIEKLLPNKVAVSQWHKDVVLERIASAKEDDFISWDAEKESIQK